MMPFFAIFPLYRGPLYWMLLYIACETRNLNFNYCLKDCAFFLVGLTHVRIETLDGNKLDLNPLPQAKCLLF